MIALLAVAWADPVADRRTAAERALAAAQSAHEAGTGLLEDVYRWSVRVRDAAQAAGDAGAAEAHARRMEALVAATRAKVEIGVARTADLDAARWYALDARLAVGTSSAPGSAPAAPAAGGGPEACFSECDRAYGTCTTEAEHLRLGVGAVPPAPECTRLADGRCGAGRSVTATECRDRELRTCVAATRTAACAKEQTLCAARCR